jgi:glycosyltransferase involved in cell wall biosynthesis
MKILFVTSEHPGNPLGGLGVYTARQCTGLRALGHEVKIILINIMHLDNTEAQKLYPVDYTFTPKSSYPTETQEGKILDTSAYLAYEVSKVEESFQPDVIHLNDRQTFLPFRFSKRAIYSKHLIISDLFGTQGMNFTWFQELNIEKMAVTQSEFVLAYSRFMVDRIYKSLSVHPTILQLPLGIPLEDYSDSGPSKELRIAYFGRFENVQKGFLEFTRAVEVLGTDFLKKYKVVLSLYGKGELPDNFDQSPYKYVGYKSGKALQKAYRNTDIVVMPSRYEPFGYVGLEALASGCALLVTKGLGMDEYLTDDNHIPITDDYNDIAKKLRSIIMDHEARKALRLKARKSVEHWTLERSIQAHEQAYQYFLGPDSNLVKKMFSSSGWNQLKTIQVNPAYAASYREALSNISDKILGKGKVLLLGPGAAFLSPEYGTRRIPGTMGSEDILQGRCEILPYDEKSWDIVVLLGALETSLDPISIFKEVQRVTKSQVFYLHSDPLTYLGRSVKMGDLNAAQKTFAENINGQSIEQSSLGNGFNLISVSL